MIVLVEIGHLPQTALTGTALCQVRVHHSGLTTDNWVSLRVVKHLSHLMFHHYLDLGQKASQNRSRRYQSHLKCRHHLKKARA